MKRYLPESLARLLHESRGMPLDKVLTHLRLRLWRRLGLRSDLATLRRRGRVESVLFVCHGNIIRSPVAEELFRTRVSQRGYDIGAGSSGTWAVKWRRADPRAVVAARAMGISIERHRSRGISPATVTNADLICVMDYRTEVDVLTRFPGSAQKTILLGALDRSTETGPVVADPIAGGPEDVEACCQRLSRAVDALIDVLRSEQGRGLQVAPGAGNRAKP